MAAKSRLSIIARQILIRRSYPFPWGYKGDLGKALPPLQLGEETEAKVTELMAKERKAREESRQLHQHVRWDELMACSSCR